MGAGGRTNFSLGAKFGGNFLGHRGTPISRSGTSINLSSLIPPIGTRNSHYLARSCILVVSAMIVIIGIPLRYNKKSQINIVPT